VVPWPWDVWPQHGRVCPVNSETGVPVPSFPDFTNNFNITSYIGVMPTKWCVLPEIGLPWLWPVWVLWGLDLAIS